MRPLSSGRAALITGADAYFEAMAVPGRARLLLVDGPAVLGLAEMRRIDRLTGGDELRQGLEYAMVPPRPSKATVEALAELLSAAFDRAALAIAEGNSAAPCRSAIRRLIESLV